MAYLPENARSECVAPSTFPVGGVVEIMRMFHAACAGIPPARLQADARIGSRRGRRDDRRTGLGMTAGGGGGGGGGVPRPPRPPPRPRCWRLGRGGAAGAAAPRVPAALLRRRWRRGCRRRCRGAAAADARTRRSPRCERRYEPANSRRPATTERRGRDQMSDHGRRCPGSSWLTAVSSILCMRSISID